MDRAAQDRLIEKGREFTKGERFDDPYLRDFESDQDLKLPQPPLVKAAVTPNDTHIQLTRNFKDLSIKNDLISLIRDRKSSRIYTEELITLDQLAFLLWATQGIKSIRGKSYATLRTVPCGGARHQFETYLVVKNIVGLEPGAYHYLPMEHALEHLGPVENLDQAITDSLCGQSWANKANVVFYWSMVPYRTEWRYGIYAHRVALIDLGHVGQALYTACTGLGLGCCGIGSFSHEICGKMFGLDQNEEYIVYTTPVGTIRDCDKESEQSFYQFVIDEGL